MRSRKVNDRITMYIMDSREDWLKARSNRVGGSEAAAIVGMNPYMSNTDLWDIKTGRKIPEDISDKPYVKFGTEAEPLMRELFKLDYPEYKVGYVENNMFLNSQYPWAHASLDGWLMDADDRIGVFENKTTEILQSMQKEKWKDRIPDNYYLQVLHYMAVMEADFAILKARLRYRYDEEVFVQVRHYHIERSEVEDDIAYLMNEERKFYESLKSGKRPNTLLPEL